MSSRKTNKKYSRLKTDFRGEDTNYHVNEAQISIQIDTVHDTANLIFNWLGFHSVQLDDRKETLGEILLEEVEFLKKTWQGYLLYTPCKHNKNLPFLNRHTDWCCTSEIHSKTNLIFWFC